MINESGNTPPIEQTLSGRLLNRLQTFGQQNDIVGETTAVIDYLLRGYPTMSVRQISLTSGMARETIEKLLDYRGIPRLNQAEATQVMKEKGQGLFRLTPEQKREAGRIGGDVSLKRGVGIHGLTADERTAIVKKAGSVSGKKARDTGTRIFAQSPEQLLASQIKGGQRATELKAGFHGLTDEERSAASSKGAARAIALQAGIHGLTREEKQATARLGGTESARKGVGGHGIDPQSGRRFAVIGGERSYALGSGIHAQTPDERRELGIEAHDAMSSKKIIYENNYFDSQVEAAVATSLATFIPEFVVQRGENFQVFIPEVLKTVDFVIDDILIEYNPIILWHSDGHYLGAFNTRGEYEQYQTYLHSLEDAEKPAYKQQVIEALLQQYYEKRRAAIDQNPDYRDRELIVVENPGQLYEDVIIRFGQNIPPTRKDFVQFFRMQLNLIKHNMTQMQNALNH